MRTIPIVVAVLIVATFVACKPPVTPPPDASDSGPPLGDASSSSSAACGNLATLQCAEGLAANCAAVLDHVVSARLTAVDLVCMANARTKTDARACPGVTCP